MDNQTDKNIVNEYDDALRRMVYQYCTAGFGKDIVFNNRCMTAGEHAFKVLGIKNGQSVPGDWFQ